MIRKSFFAAALLLITVSGMAGTIGNGMWSPNGCGTEPPAPAIDQGSVDAYNLSVKAVNEWQKLANTYNTCLINEANTDNAIIAKTANDAQARLRAAIDKINTDVTAAKAKLDKQ
ncbi:MAG: hypothetical protein PHY16_05755 [Methylobacter sp.]|nr:hypothetical protein [Methylobacter sp.]